MVILSVIVKGLAIGILMAIPVGPSGAISARRAITNGPMAGFISGLGASAADAVYLWILVLGESWILPHLNIHWMRALGGAFVAYTGARVLAASHLPAVTLGLQDRGKLRILASSFVLSVINPSILASFAVMLVVFGLTEMIRVNHLAIVLVISVCSGSAMLWFVLARALASKKLSGVFRSVIGASFVVMGAVIIYSAVDKLIAGS
jgi:threonine/homoserine/homoserine lactone efflux protein